MHTALSGGWRPRWRVSLTLVAVAFVLAFALSSVARAADEQFCYGSVKTAKDVGADTARFGFSCRAPITGFVLMSNQQIARFDVSADVFDSPGEGGALRGDDRFGECEGDLPSFGFRCTGTYSGLGRFVRATFDGLDSPCARDARRHVKARYSLVVVDKSGKVAGPYELGKTKGCPKAKKAKAKHHS